MLVLQVSYESVGEETPYFSYTLLKETGQLNDELTIIVAQNVTWTEGESDMDFLQRWEVWSRDKWKTRTLGRRPMMYQSSGAGACRCECKCALVWEVFCSCESAPDQM